jgi:hypothetical protein
MGGAMFYMKAFRGTAYGKPEESKKLNFFGVP